MTNHLSSEEFLKRRVKIAAVRDIKTRRTLETMTMTSQEGVKNNTKLRSKMLIHGHKPYLLKGSRAFMLYSFINIVVVNITTTMVVSIVSKREKGSKCIGRKVYMRIRAEFIGSVDLIVRVILSVRKIMKLFQGEGHSTYWLLKQSPTTVRLLGMLIN
ncbi:hypothetical protein KQX54_020564 [Cotesia glomerata]|uniref:Transmembrane protein n=1 Tax=Cotesia glomerata TaxID=32391 RepID=A0AAV7J5U0_COTGL|nr:hypothetical protein KQX54_020564 [Cotesia glomerata]